MSCSFSVPSFPHDGGSEKQHTEPKRRPFSLSLTSTSSWFSFAEALSFHFRVADSCRKFVRVCMRLRHAFLSGGEGESGGLMPVMMHCLRMYVCTGSPKRFSESSVPLPQCAGAPVRQCVQASRVRNRKQSMHGTVLLLHGFVERWTRDELKTVEASWLRGTSTR